MAQKLSGKLDRNLFCFWIYTYNFRSGIRKESVISEKFEYKGGKTRGAGMGKIDLFGKQVTFRMKYRRKVNLDVIGKWLQKEHKLDDSVIEALSQYSLVPRLLTKCILTFKTSLTT